MKQVSDPHQRLRLGDAPLVVALDPSSSRLLRYCDYSTAGGRGRGGGGSVKVDAGLFGERDGVQVGVGRGLGRLGRGLRSFALGLDLQPPAAGCGASPPVFQSRPPCHPPTIHPNPPALLQPTTRPARQNPPTPAAFQLTQPQTSSPPQLRSESLTPPHPPPPTPYPTPSCAPTHSPPPHPIPPPFPAALRLTNLKPPARQTHPHPPTPTGT